MGLLRRPTTSNLWKTDDWAGPAGGRAFARIPENQFALRRQRHDGRASPTFRSETGKELFDLPDAPRPDPDTPAPVRFLPQFDNVALSHADRSHISAGDAAARWPADDLHWSAILVDGFGVCAWRLSRDRKAATLVVRLLGPVPDRSAVEEEEESSALLAFVPPTPSSARSTSPASAGTAR